MLNEGMLNEGRRKQSVGLVVPFWHILRACMMLQCCFCLQLSHSALGLLFLLRQLRPRTMSSTNEPTVTATGASTTDFVLASTQPYSPSNMRRARGNKRRRFFPGGEAYYRGLPWSTDKIKTQVNNLLNRRRKYWIVIFSTLSLFVLTDILMRVWYPSNDYIFWTIATAYLAASFGFFYGMYQEMTVQWKLDEMVDNLPAGWDEVEDNNEDGNGNYEAPGSSSSSSPSHELT